MHMKLIKLALYLIVFVVALQLLLPVDSTDKSKWNRSGMSLYIDYGTGCEYLNTGMFCCLSKTSNASNDPSESAFEIIP